MAERIPPTPYIAFVPAMRPTPTSCPVRGCVSDHHGEQPGQRSHWAASTDVHTSAGPLFVDVNEVDGRAPEIVLTDADDHERRLAATEAVAYGRAIIAAASALLGGVMA